MVVIRYSPEGKAVSDFEVENLAKEIVQLAFIGADHVLEYSTSNVFRAVQVEVAVKKKIDGSQIVFGAEGLQEVLAQNGQVKMHARIFGRHIERTQILLDHYFE